MANSTVEIMNKGMKCLTEHMGGHRSRALYFTDHTGKV